MACVNICACVVDSVLEESHHFDFTQIFKKKNKYFFCILLQSYNFILFLFIQLLIQKQYI